MAYNYLATIVAIAMEMAW